MIKSKLTKNSGITSTVLVITIIVMLILAGVIYNGIIKDNLTIDQSIVAKDKAVQADLNEKVALVNHTTKIKGTIESYTLSELKAEYENGLPSENFKISTYKYDEYNLIKINYIGNEMKIPVYLTWFVDELSLNFAMCLVRSEDTVEISKNENNVILKLLGLSDSSDELKCLNIEYAESTGNEYINLGFKPNNNTRVVFDGMVISGDCAPFGVRDKSTLNAYTLQYIGSNQYRIKYSSEEVYIDKKYENSKRYLFDFEKNKLLIDGKLVATAKEATFLSNYNLALFAMNTAETIERTGNIICYSLKIYDNNTLIRDLTPIIAKNGLVCFHNIAHDKDDLSTGFEYYFPENGMLKHNDVNIVINAINNIGIVNTESKEKIKYAENLYFQLEDSLKANVTNYNVLLEANKSFVDTNEYREISYIESTGIQYIDTGIIPDQNTRVIYDGMVISGDTALFGAREDSALRTYALQYINGDKYRNNYGTVQSILSTTYKKNVRYVFDLNKNVLSINDTVVNTIKNQTFRSPCNMVLFGVNTNGKVGNLGNVRCYSCKIYNGDTLVRDFIPVIDGEYKPALYDKVEGKFYYNSNTGDDFCYEL